MKIRVVIPCFNEGKSLQTHQQLTEILSQDSSVKAMIIICFS